VDAGGERRVRVAGLDVISASNTSRVGRKRVQTYRDEDLTGIVEVDDFGLEFLSPTPTSDTTTLSRPGASSARGSEVDTLPEVSRSARR